jgi:hypothetical protein
MFTREQIETAVKAKKYVWFEGTTDFDVNIVGIRNATVGKKVTNVFDDWMTVSYKDGGVWKFHIWPCTTDPGAKPMMEYQNVKGVARLVEGQYRGSHAIGLHKGQYEALRQVKPLKVWRDDTKDMVFDEKLIDVGIFGINIHRSNPKTESTYVENWSEGCQVFKRVKDFDLFMDICRKAKDIHGNSFTYTLISTQDIK